MAEALRIGETMSAHAHVDVDKPGRDDDFAFDMQLLRDFDGGSTRTIIEMREVGDTRSIVSELVEKPGEPLTSWYWDLQKRRWVRVRGMLATDPFADTTFALRGPLVHRADAAPQRSREVGRGRTGGASSRSRAIRITTTCAW